MGFSLKLRFLASGALITGLVWLYSVAALREQRAIGLLVRQTFSQDVARMSLAFEIQRNFILYDDLIFRFLSTGD
jgi:hypothetical protein